MYKNKKRILLLVLLLFTILAIKVNKINPKTNFKEDFNNNLLRLTTPTDWLENGSAISTEANNQEDLQMCSDGAGGAIITWEDYRFGSSSFIYAQRINSNGTTLWNSNGILVCVNGYAVAPKICGDGAGGAIIVWHCNWSGPDYDIYAQKIDTNGNLLWMVNGTSICSAANSQIIPEICTDGVGGAIITWRDFRSGISWDLYAQSIDASGSVRWAVNGIPICTESFDQSSQQIVSDGNGGAILTWDDIRNGAHYDIYAQRVNAGGSILWGLNGILICNLSEDQQFPQICSDGIGGAIITWFDYVKSNISLNDIFAQRVNPNGVVQWTINGIAVCGAINDQWLPQLCSDGLGGTIITWIDHRSGIDFDIYAQKVDVDGNIEWVNDGIMISGEIENQLNPQICSDGLGGAYITWIDYRNGIDSDIYAQPIDLNGIISKYPNGKRLCSMNNDQLGVQVCPNGAGTALISWYDNRSGSSYDIYAQFIGKELVSLQIDNINFLLPFLIVLAVLAIYITITSKFINLNKIRTKRAWKKKQKLLETKIISDEDLFELYRNETQRVARPSDNFRHASRLLEIEEEQLISIKLSPLEYQQEMVNQEGKSYESISNAYTHRDEFRELRNFLETEKNLEIQQFAKTNPSIGENDILLFNLRNFKGLLLESESGLEIFFARIFLEVFCEYYGEIFSEYIDKLIEVIGKNINLKFKGFVIERTIFPDYFSIILNYIEEKSEQKTRVLSIKKFKEKFDFKKIGQSITKYLSNLSIEV